MSMDIVVRINIAEMQAKLDALQAELDEAKTITQVDVQKVVDESEVKLKQVDNAAQKTKTSMITTVRRSAQLGLSLAQAFGFAVDQSLQMTVEATMLGIETIAKIQEAESLAGIGWATVIPNALAISSMVVMVVLLQQKRKENAQRMSYVVSAFRLLAF